jgi:hypothetical protein
VLVTFHLPHVPIISFKLILIRVSISSQFSAFRSLTILNCSTSGNWGVSSTLVIVAIIALCSLFYYIILYYIILKG